MEAMEAAIKRGQQLYGIADFRHGMNGLARKAMCGACTLNGVEVPRLVFYVDTEAGVVKTFDLCGVPFLPESLADGRVHSFSDFQAKGGIMADDLEVLDGISIVCQVRRGKVELFAKAE